MCESSVFLLKGSERILVVHEAAKVIVTGDGVTCIDALGEKKTIPDATIFEANLVNHEILLKPRL